MDKHKPIDSMLIVRYIRNSMHNYSHNVYDNTVLTNQENIDKRFHFVNYLNTEYIYLDDIDDSNNLEFAHILMEFEWLTQDDIQAEMNRLLEKDNYHDSLMYVVHRYQYELNSFEKDSLVDVHKLNERNI